MAEATSSEITRKKIRDQVSASIGEVLTSLHIHTQSKKVKKLVEKSSKKIASKVMKEMKKEARAKKKVERKAPKKKAK
ncbi:MAG: hypothetical protein QM734_16395 [Cyclobacteriaceae bacterium]